MVIFLLLHSSIAAVKLPSNSSLVFLTQWPRKVNPNSTHSQTSLVRFSRFIRTYSKQYMDFDVNVSCKYQYYCCTCTTVAQRDRRGRIVIPPPRPAPHIYPHHFRRNRNPLQQHAGPSSFPQPSFLPAVFLVGLLLLPCMSCLGPCLRSTLLPRLRSSARVCSRPNRALAPSCVPCGGPSFDVHTFSLYCKRAFLPQVSAAFVCSTSGHTTLTAEQQGSDLLSPGTIKVVCPWYVVGYPSSLKCPSVQPRLKRGVHTMSSVYTAYPGGTENSSSS